MLFFAFLVLALTLLIASVALKSTLLGIIAAGGWILLGVYSYTLSATPATGIWDVYYALFFIGMFVAFVAGFEGYQIRRRKIITDKQGKIISATITEEDEDGAFLEEESSETNRQMEKAQSKRKKRAFRRPW
jgi:hypothetical protein